jgi:hypothetical protein
MPRSPIPTRDSEPLSICTRKDACCQFKPPLLLLFRPDAMCGRQMVDRQKREETEQPNGWEQQYQSPRRFQQEPVDAESHRSRDQDREDERSKATMNALLFVSYAGLSVNKL